MPIKLNYQSYGEGKSVIILHGLLGSSRNWTSIAKKLSVNFQIINVDLRNHGDSDHADTMTYPEMAEDICQVLDKCGLEQASLIGHSMGGKVAMNLALNHQSYIKHLIVLDIAPASYRGEFMHLIDALQRLPVNEIKNRKQADETLQSDIPETMLRQFLLQNLVQDGNGFRWRINLGVIKTSLELLAGFPEADPGTNHNGPVLFLRGENSDYLRSEHFPMIEKYFPMASMHTIKNAGHWLHAEQPQAVLDKITSFLTDHL